MEPSYDGLKYTILFLDDFTAKSNVFLLKNKSELFDFLYEFKARAETELQQQRVRLTNLRLDDAREG